MTQRLYVPGKPSIILPDDDDDVSTRLGLANVPAWVPLRSNPADDFFDFANDRAWRRNAGGIITPVSSILTTARNSSKYVWDSSNNYSSVSANVLARSDLGALLEEARTNSIRNSSNSGAVVGVLGAGGALPTNWATGGVATGLTYSVVGTGTESGIDYVDVRISGTAAATASPTIIFDGASGGQAAASNGQTWACSVFARLVAGSFANFGPWVDQISYRDAANASLTIVPGTDATAAMTSAANIGSNRISAIGSASNASTAFVRNQFQTSIANGLTVDATIRFGWPQLELGGSVTSPIRTTSAAVGRAADVVTLTTPGVFGSAYSLYASAVPLTPIAFGSAQAAVNVSFDTNNRVSLRRNLTTGAPLLSIVGGSGGDATSAAVWAQNASGKIAAGLAAGSQGLSFGGDITTATGATLPTAPTVVSFGVASVVSNFWLNGFLKEAGIKYASRWSNTELQSIAA